MANLFEDGEHWELAVEVLKELVPVYESILFDFQQLASLLRKLAELYSKITLNIRLRTTISWLLSTVKMHPPTCPTANSYFEGEFLESMEDCEDTYGNAAGKYIQIIPVMPQPSEVYSRLDKSSHRLARWYYKHHKVVRFEHSRREIRSNTKVMDCHGLQRCHQMWLKRKYISIEKPLPDILKFAQVVNEHEPEVANPVDVAVKNVQEENEKLKENAQLVDTGFKNFLVNLGGCIRGVVQADVGGGIKNYQVGRV
uniref:DOCKER domain-containing protein n=1 Tax=Ditylenchus dipsaci TaxID=166011 RepID=A0A915E0Y7_9BILA